MFRNPYISLGFTSSWAVPRGSVCAHVHLSGWSARVSEYLFSGGFTSIWAFSRKAVVAHGHLFGWSSCVSESMLFLWFQKHVDTPWNGAFIAHLRACGWSACVSGNDALPMCFTSAWALLLSHTCGHPAFPRLLSSLPPACTHLAPSLPPACL